MPDPSSYDLGSYGLSPQPGMAPGGPPQPQHPRTQPPQRQPQPHWPPQQPVPQAAADGYGFQGYPPPAAPQPGAYPAGLGYQNEAQPQYASAGHPQAQVEDDYLDETEYEDEPPRRRRRWLIALALVGSIGVGSGMAYAYKIFLGPKGDKSQVVRAPREPAKVAPSDRGGRQFANTDSQILNNRVPSEGSAVSSGGDVSGGYTDSNGVRRVAVVPVGPSVVPGMTIVGPGTGPAATPPPAPSPISASPGANLLPPSMPATRPAAAVQSPPVVRQPVPRIVSSEPESPPPARIAAATPKPPAAERPRVVSGYVAVLGFQKSQLDAMKMMADLQQKYEVLRDRKLEIIQSDQSARGLGTIYRVVIGPRGGIGPVREICSQLQQAGMSKQGCYPLGE